MKRFSAKTVIVTGGASGIGAATVRRLYDEGANVVIADLQEDAASALAQDIGDPQRLLVHALDVSDAEAVEALMEACVERFGVPDGLANCAGVRGVGSILETDLDLFRRNVAINLEGGFNTCKAFAQRLVDAGKGGAIVNVSSAAGIQGVPNRLAYVASKHGVIGLTRGAALDLGKYGIRVNVVTPGMIHTPMTAPMFEDPENVDRIRAAHPIGREGMPEEIAAAIAFALADEVAFMTGAVIPVDGGSSVGQPSH